MSVALGHRGRRMLYISTMKPSGGLDVLNDQVGHNQTEAIVGE
jgi:hypothetical protein